MTALPGLSPGLPACVLTTVGTPWRSTKAAAIAGEGGSHRLHLENVLIEHGLPLCRGRFEIAVHLLLHAGEKHVADLHASRRAEMLGELLNLAANRGHRCGQLVGVGLRHSAAGGDLAVGREESLAELLALLDDCQHPRISR